MFSCSRASLLIVLSARVSGQKCPYVPCRDDTDCSKSSACSWCSSPNPGKQNNQTCSGPPDPDDCGVLPGPNATAKLQYASWGDSVSKGILHPVGELLTDYEVFHPSSNVGGGCGNVIRGKYCTDLWLHGEGGVANASHKWDLITFNFGLHDLAQDSENVKLHLYKQNLRNITKRLLDEAGRLFWVSSTPVPNVTLAPPRTQSDVAIYNAAAQEVMDKLGVPIIDIYAFVIKKCGGDEHYTTCPGFQHPNNVHFEPAGYSAMAKYIFDAVTAAVVVV